MGKYILRVVLLPVLIVVMVVFILIGIDFDIKTTGSLFIKKKGV